MAFNSRFTGAQIDERLSYEHYFRHLVNASNASVITNDGRSISVHPEIAYAEVSLAATSKWNVHISAYCTDLVNGSISLDDLERFYGSSDILDSFSIHSFNAQIDNGSIVINGTTHYLSDAFLKMNIRPIANGEQDVRSIIVELYCQINNAACPISQEDSTLQFNLVTL